MSQMQTACGVQVSVPLVQGGQFDLAGRLTSLDLRSGPVMTFHGDSWVCGNALVMGTGAIRDEGTSCHYLPAGKEIARRQPLSAACSFWRRTFWLRASLPEVAWGRVRCS